MATTLAGCDSVLLRRARRDPEAFRDFYRIHADWVYRWFAGRVGDPQLAADLTAETFAQALLGIARFRAPTRGRGRPGSSESRGTSSARPMSAGGWRRLRGSGWTYRSRVPPEDAFEAAEERLDADMLAAEIGEALS